MGKQFQQGDYMGGSGGARRVKGVLAHLGQAPWLCVSKNREVEKQQLNSLGWKCTKTA